MGSGRERSGTPRSEFLGYPHQILTRPRGRIPLGARTVRTPPRVRKPEILATAPGDSSSLSTTLWRCRARTRTSRSGFSSKPHQILTRSRGRIPLGARTTENSPRVGKPEILATAPDDSSRLSNTLWMVSSANDQIRRHGRSFRGRKPKSGQLLEETPI